MDNEAPASSSSSSKGKNISPPLSITDDHDQPDKKKRKVITDEKKIEKMKKELFSEAKALSEDFGVDVCLVCYDPNQPTAVVSVWPEDSQKLNSVIERLKTENPSIPYSEPSFTITDGEAEAEAEVENEIELQEDEELQEEEELQEDEEEEELQEDEEEEELQEDEEEEELSEDEANRKLEELLKMKEKIEAKLKEKEEEQERRSFITQRNNN